MLDVFTITFQVVQRDTERNNQDGRLLIVTNVTFATAGKYICSAQFGNVIAEKDVYIDIKSKFMIACFLIE